MIYCNLKGGLGNMLFQIAASKSFAIDMGTDSSFPNLRSHLSYLNDDDKYNPQLKHTSDYIGILKNLLAEQPTTSCPIISFPFEYTNNKLPSNNVYIDGFFQSEKYFNHNKTEILEYLNINSIDVGPLLVKYGIDINKNNTSVHIRRGDYLNHPNHHPVQSVEYYNKSMTLLDEVTDNFIFFSDDILWVKANLNSPKGIYIDNEKDYIELKLMTMCKNNIICNSSFSWWGAWLNENPTKKVVGPLKWFGESIPHNTDDILPLNYIKL